MPATFSFGKYQFDLSPGSHAARVDRDPESPFHLAVLGDFTGRAARGMFEPGGSCRLVEVDCDNFESVMKGLGAALVLPASGSSGINIQLRFESMEDFHPDRIIAAAKPLSALAETRARLRNPATADAAAVEARHLLAGSSEPSISAAPAAAAGESIQDTMARLLGGNIAPAPAASKPTAGGINLNALIKGIVAPNIVPGATPEQSAALTAIELELAAGLRAILRHPHFQNLEALWRGLDLLVRAHGGEEKVKLHVLDVSKAELIADVRAHENLQQTAVCRTLREAGLAVIVAAFTFDDTLEDIETLGRAANISSMLGVAFVAGANPHFAGCDSFALHPDAGDWTYQMSAESGAAWAALRALPEAKHLGLVCPRVLLRQPYGKASDPIELFSFEEMAVGTTHESFLWASSGFVVGHLLADAFREDGWELSSSGWGELDDLPVFKFVEDGETKVKPCAEAWLSERSGERIQEQGIMPLLSIKGRGAVRLACLQSVSNPAMPLAIRRA